MSKARKGIHNNILWILFISVVIVFAGELAWDILMTDIDIKNAYLYTFMRYTQFISMWISVILAITIFKKNRYIMDFITTKTKGNNIYNLLLGFLFGFILNISSAIIALLHGDISLIFVKFEVFHVICLFIAVFIQSSAEELLCRGFMYQRFLKSISNPAVAIFLNSFLFAVLHLFNDGMGVLAFYDLLVTGIFFSLIVFYFDSLWMAMGVHTTWNFTQSILLGLPNSGTSFPYSVYKLDTLNVYGSFAYNTEFGLEGTILSSVIMTGCCIGLYLWKNKSRNIFKNYNYFTIKDNNTNENPDEVSIYEN